MIVLVVLWNVPIAIGWWYDAIGRGGLASSVLTGAWMLAAWFSAAWRARFFTPDAPSRLTDEQVLLSVAMVLGMGVVWCALG
jgi:hypothetical protein